jgi:oligopeptide transport system substrate-binding protein
MDRPMTSSAGPIVRPRRAGVWTLAFLLAASLLLLVAKAEFRGGMPTTPGTTSASASVPQTPRRGGTLRLAFRSDWRSLDPAISPDTDSIPLTKLLFRGLLDFDDGVGLVCDQASDWNISPDGKTYTFHLRPGVRFSNGREVETEDYVFSFERVLDPKSGAWAQTFFLDILGAKEFRDGKAEHVKGLHAPDPRTFIIELEEPKFTFRYVLTMAAAAVVPREVVRQYGRDFQYHMSGSGPYRIAQWRRDVSYRLERNPHYSGPDGFVDAVDIRIGGDQTVYAMLVERDELDRTQATLADAIRFRRDPRRRSWLQLVDTPGTMYFFMNTEIKPFDDVRVRQAVSYAINVDRLWKLNGSFGVVAHQVVPPSMPWSNPGLQRHEYNPENARKLLRDAGLPKGFKTQLWCSGTGNRTAEGIQQDLKEVGINAELHGINQDTYWVKAGSRGQVPCGIAGWIEDYPDPSDFLDVLFNGAHVTETDCVNLAFYNNPAVTKLLDQANRSMKADERTRLFQDAEVMVMYDAPWVPFVHPQMLILNNPRLHGTQPHPVWGCRYERMWVDL